MKKLIIASACVLATAGAAFAQGNVNWTGPSAAAFTAQTNSGVYSSFSALNPGGAVNGGGTVGNTTGVASTGSGFYFELLIGSVWAGSAQAAPSTFGGLGAWSDTGLEASNNPAALSTGRFIAMQANSGTTLNGMSTSVSNNLIMVGWSANLGATYAAALANAQNSAFLTALQVAGSTAFWGVSHVGFLEALASTSAVGTTLFGNSTIAQGTPISSLLTPLDVIAPVPEPGTLALAALGGASLLLFRRKK